MPDFNWQKCENDAEWRLTQQHIPAMVTSQPHARRRLAWAVRHWSLGVVLLLVLFTSGGWAWYAAQQGIARTELELRNSIEVELWTSAQIAQNTMEAELRKAMAASEVVIETKIRDLGEDWALVDVQLLPIGDGPVYQQTRVYHYRNGTWVRAAVAAEHWGQVRKLESRYFVFQYRSVDHDVVVRVIAQVDDLYAALYAAFFSGAPVGEKLVVVLDPDWIARRDAAQSRSPVALTVPSPAAILAPTELPLEDLLLQSLMLVLFDKLAGGARDAYELPSQWLPLRNGLLLWLIWSQKMPLSIWQESLVKWTLKGLDKTAQAPQFAHDLCVHHKLWMRSPLEAGVPIQCLQTVGGEKVIALRYNKPTQELALPSLADLQPNPDGTNPMKQPAESAASGVAWATVLDYTAATFGTEKVPVLLIALQEHEQWETLVPAVFGLSLAEFASGWQAFLATQYDRAPELDPIQQTGK